MIKTASIFSQLLRFFPQTEFTRIVRKHKAEKAAKGFTSWGNQRERPAHPENCPWLVEIEAVDAGGQSVHHCHPMNAKKPWKVISVPSQPSGGRRLDVWLAKNVAEISRNRAKQILANEAVLVNGRPARKSALLSGGEQVEILVDPGGRDWTAAADPDQSLDVIHEDAYLIVVEKPSGTASVPLSHAELGTVANAIAARYPECASIQRRPGDSGLIQRLDNETSGLMIAARTREAFEILLEMQAGRRIEKRYLALAQNAPGAPTGEIDAPLEGSPARTLVRPVRESGRFVLLEAIIHRGARHQIRLHLSGAGFPIAGDKLCGGPAIDGLGRLFLHAEGLRFAHPISGDEVVLESELPPELALHLG